ncbi:class I SAM-dependent methyltransferase [Azorhizobium doebereinerae]|uniref:class I SAM-dependent methyltransferase n=1 Tax=Azorhizobium doebereinerae TaxID=281091 RepID=UPI0003F60C53|nr:class I SAM-dependent methyltransferase [Azorhizobium doebereinerae]
MAELIHREAAAQPQDFSGERLTASISGQVEIEHYHRYLLAREFCRDKDVIDVAAGEGYGSALLSQVARSVVGVEIDAETVAAARREFARPNLRYEQGDARAIPLPDASVDVAVSFETLEHIAEHDQFLSELHRVLRPGGLLIISTPDKDIYSPPGAPPNPFHVLELTRPEFEGLLRRHFAHAAFAAQRALIGSVIIGPGDDAPVRAYERRDAATIEGSGHLAGAPYLVGFVSDAPLPPLPNSVFVYRSDIDTDPQVRREAELGWRAAEARAVAAEQQQALLAGHMAEGQAREAHAVEVIGTLEQEVAALRAQIQHWSERSAEDAARLQELEARTPWKALREAVAGLAGGAKPGGSRPS